MNTQIKLATNGNQEKIFNQMTIERVRERKRKQMMWMANKKRKNTQPALFIITLLEYLSHIISCAWGSLLHFRFTVRKYYNLIISFENVSMKKRQPQSSNEMQDKLCVSRVPLFFFLLWDLCSFQHNHFIRCKVLQQNFCFFRRRFLALCNDQRPKHTLRETRTQWKNTADA